MTLSSSMRLHSNCLKLVRNTDAINCYDRKLVSSRKRKLCELYALATSSDPIPQYFLNPNNGVSLDPGLHDFLEQNDLERYCRFTFVFYSPLLLHALDYHESFLLIHANATGDDFFDNQLSPPGAIMPLQFRSSQSPTSRTQTR